MSTVTAFEAKTRFGELLDRVASGEEIVITRHDKPVARIVPEGRRNLAQIRAAVDALAGIQKEMKRRRIRPVTDREIRDALAKGRK
jgi:prevent-host-death family protein